MSFRVFWSTLVAVKLAFTGLAETLVDGLEAIVAGLAKLPGPQQTFFKGLQDNLDKARLSLQGMAQQDLKGLGDQMSKIGSIVTTGQGSWSNTFDNVKISIGKAIDGVHNFKTAIIDFMNTPSKPGSIITPGFWDGFSKGITDAKIKLNDFFTMGKTAATQWVAAIQSNFGTFFDDFFTGKLKTSAQYFQAFGNSILKIWSNMLAQMVTAWIQSQLSSVWASLFGAVGGGGALKAFGGGAAAYTAPTASQMSGSLTLSKFHDGGPIQKAHDGLSVGEVPIIAQTGEGILSRQGMQNLAALNSGNGSGMGGNVTITITPVIQAWDSSDVLRNMGIITNGIASALVNNSQLRSIIKKYGK